MDERIAAEAARVEAQVIDWRRTFHQNPEKPNEEFETARLVARHLNQLGLEHVVTGVAGTGVVGILRGGAPGPTVALRADMDAVPGVKEKNDLPFRSTRDDVAHLCGHDANTAMLMGAATVLSRIRKDLAGNVMFIFQPAEEGSATGDAGRPEGARLMLEEGIFSERFLAGKYKPSVVFGQHFLPRDAGEVSYVAGSRLFSGDGIRVVVSEAQSTH
ncbi:MAG: M20/M25/M40 family metallo-hydrolase, partial [Steroidobacteraceae bacterium]